MTALRSVLLPLSALTGALALAACGEPPEDPSASPYAGGERAEDDAGAGAPADGDVEAGSGSEDDALPALDMAAREACAAGDEGFAGPLPDGAAFASRGPDGRVHAAWRQDGESYEAIIHTPSIDPDPRLRFDLAVADFTRHNLSAGIDRTGLTGASRFRDGSFCVVQTEQAVIEPFQAAVREAEALLAPGDG